MHQEFFHRVVLPFYKAPVSAAFLALESLSQKHVLISNLKCLPFLQFNSPKIAAKWQILRSFCSIRT